MKTDRNICLNAEHPGLSFENTRVFCVNTPGSSGLKHPGVFKLNKQDYKL